MARILSIDGGGVRGLIPALVVSRLENDLAKPAWQSFDLIAGTSAGGILACALSIGIPASRVATLFTEKSHLIFRKTAFSVIKQIVTSKYSNRSLSTEILNVLGDSAYLSDAMIEMIVTGYEVNKSKPFLFKRTAARRNRSGDFPLARVALATAAAPTYFPPVTVRSRTGVENKLIDGGVFANNPAMCAYAEAVKLFGPGPHFILSLGTGSECPDISRGVNCGMAHWVSNIFGVIMNGVSTTVHYQIAHLTSDYIRIMPNVTCKFDDSSIENIISLQREAVELCSGDLYRKALTYLSDARNSYRAN